MYKNESENHLTVESHDQWNWAYYLVGLAITCGVLCKCSTSGHYPSLLNLSGITDENKKSCECPNS